MSSSPSSTWPSVGFSRPATMRSVVVLPQPEGPSRAKNDPAGTVSVRSSTAVKTPNRLVTPTIRRSLGPAPTRPAASRTDDPLEQILVGLLLGLVQVLEAVQLRQGVGPGEDQLVGREVGVDVLRRLGRAVDRADVVDVRLDLGRDRGVVVVVDQLLRTRLVGGLDGD